jgi:hypothetical protein
VNRRLIVVRIEVNAMFATLAKQLASMSLDVVDQFLP